MAIVQSSLAEEILTRSERAVIRGIYRASQLAEAKNTLDKVESVLFTSSDDIVSSRSDKAHISKIKCYLESAIAKALMSVKTPALSEPKKADQAQEP